MLEEGKNMSGNQLMLLYADVLTAYLPFDSYIYLTGT